MVPGTGGHASLAVPLFLCYGLTPRFGWKVIKTILFFYVNVKTRFFRDIGLYCPRGVSVLGILDKSTKHLLYFALYDGQAC